MTPHGKLSAPGTVAEGGTVTIEVTSGASELTVTIRGRSRVKIPVVNGVAEFAVPPSVSGGERIWISDRLFPNPSAVGVTVVGTSQ